MLERLRQSLALRLAVQYAFVFALASALAFTALYWALASALERREQQSAANDYAIASRELSDGRVLQVGALTASRDELLRPLRRVFTSVGAGALFLSVVVGTVLAWRSTRPLRNVSDTARRILATGDFSARVPGPDGGGELAVLVRQLNTLLEKNSTHVRVLRETL